MKRLFSTIVLCLILTAIVTPARAQSTETCSQQVAQRMQLLHDQYRRVIFGSTGHNLFPDKPSDPNDGVTILKTGGVLSGSIAGDKRDLAGIFETKGRMTSELIDPLVESYRVFRCKGLNLCDMLAANAYGNASSTVQHLGCPVETLPALDKCSSAQTSQVDAQATIEFCQTLLQSTLDAERSALKLAVAYDSGYRSLVQVSGMFDAFLQDFSRTAFFPIRQMIALLGKLHRIPCFLPQCDLPPEDIIYQP